MEQYLYFPKCKITRADTLPGHQTGICTFIIRSSQLTPKHYPEHFMLKGKPEFFFKINFNGFAWMNKCGEQFKTIFGDIELLKKAHKLIGKEISVIAYFSPQSDIKLDCIGIGLSNEEPILFNNDRSNDENSAYVKIAVLGSKLIGNKTKEKKLKI